MGKIHQTRPHYIRCLKPNDDNAPDALNRSRLTEQLRYGGVLEAVGGCAAVWGDGRTCSAHRLGPSLTHIQINEQVRVARSGYPVRLPHSEFYARYRCLATAPGPPSSSPSSPPRNAGSFPYHIDGLAAEPSRAWCGRVLDAVLALQVRCR